MTTSNPQANSTSSDPSLESSVKKTMVSAPDDEDDIWARVPSLDPEAVDQALCAYEMDGHSKGKGKAEVYGIGGEEEEDVCEFYENDGSANGAMGITSGSQPLYMLVPMQTMYPMALGPSGQAQARQRMPQQASPLSRHSSPQKQQQQQQQQQQPFRMQPLSPLRKQSVVTGRHPTMAAGQQTKQSLGFESPAGPSTPCKGSFKPSRATRGSPAEGSFGFR